MTFSRLLIVILLALRYLPVSASDLPDPLFQSEETLQVTLTAPIATLVEERSTEQPVTGIFKFKDTDGSYIELDTEILARGHFRHKNCEFPPLRLNFKKAQVRGTLFDQQNKLKLVVHCDDSFRYQQSLLREYLAYRLLNALTDQSFRVRLLQVTYVDSEERRGRMVRYAYLIEHKNRLASRLGRKDLEIEATTISSIQPDHLNLTSLFQYLLGNTDFSPIAGRNDECCHNYVLFGNEVDRLIAVPYDFDQSGFVNAAYAVPNEQLGISSVRQRVYRGRCVNNEYIEDSIGQFRKNRDQLYAMIAGQEGLQSSVSESLANYMDEFYEIINDPGSLELRIKKACLQ